LIVCSAIEEAARASIDLYRRAKVGKTRLARQVWAKSAQNKKTANCGAHGVGIRPRARNNHHIGLVSGRTAVD
jgi:hypothetical protein